MWSQLALAMCLFFQASLVHPSAIIDDDKVTVPKRPAQIDVQVSSNNENDKILVQNKLPTGVIGVQTLRLRDIDQTNHLKVLKGLTPSQLRMATGDVIGDILVKLIEQVHQQNEDIEDIRRNTATMRNLDLELGGIEDEFDIMKKNIQATEGMPIGSIVAWVSQPQSDAGSPVTLPEGWQRCDGSAITDQSQWSGSLTPNLNGEKRFLRGGTDAEALTLQDDMIQDHIHQDTGHSHADGGHTHGYYDRVASNDASGPIYGHGGTMGTEDNSRITNEGYASIQQSNAKITNPTSGRHGPETRPTNMSILWIMRVF